MTARRDTSARPMPEPRQRDLNSRDRGRTQGADPDPEMPSGAPATMARSRPRSRRTGMNADGVVSAFHVPANLESLAFVRSATACILQRGGWPSADAGRILLACGEAVNNAIEHGSPAGGHVRVELVVTMRCARVRVVDDGVGAPPPVCPQAPPPVTSARGRGLLIMRTLADDLAIRRSGTGTAVSLRFERAPSSASAARRAA